MDAPLPSNRLISEKSPYLLQHAHNPVDWYPWGQEAFSLAKKGDKPIFLSIGYATCHWCHVMEKESFENREIATLLNEAFVNIKVDREELPEVDAIYMEFAQALMSSAGGWPLNVILTPDLKPFFAVTYLPPVNKRGLIGMTQFIQHIHTLWQSEERAQLVEQADKMVEIFEKSTKTSADELPTEQHLQMAIETMFELIDPVYGGLKGEPKFPMGYQALFLLKQAKLKGDSRALFCVELTLEMMMRGGIYDQLGGGFARYAVDEKWIIPHFEKMLYDNTLLASIYLEAWRYSKKEPFRQVVEETVAYLMRDMAHPEGGFYSAQDADVNGQEGVFYTWTLAEMKEVLSQDELEILSQYYAVSPSGNFEGRSVLHCPFSLEEFSEQKGKSAAEVNVLIRQAKEKLFQKRALRPLPFKDDKILTSWNGLAIDVMVQAGSAFNLPQYREAAVKTAHFIKAHLYQEGRLLRRWRDGEARFTAGIDDYAFLIKGVLSLFSAGCGSEWLAMAIQLADTLDKEFKAEEGGYYFSISDPSLLIRKCEYYDGAEPSGNAVHCENLLRLYKITRDEKYLKSAEAILKGAKNYIEMYPPGACYHLLSLQFYLDLKAPTIVIALDEERSLEQEITQHIATQFNPHLQVIWKAANDSELLKWIPSLVDKNPVDGQTAIYFCQETHCEAPLIEKEEILKRLGETR
jgi:uncharacterized protein YyaL (SSP411 family)